MQSMHKANSNRRAHHCPRHAGVSPATGARNCQPGTNRPFQRRRPSNPLISWFSALLPSLGADSPAPGFRMRYAVGSAPAPAPEPDIPLGRPNQDLDATASTADCRAASRSIWPLPASARGRVGLSGAAGILSCANPPSACCQARVDTTHG